MRLRVIVFALVATAVAVGLVVAPSVGARPKPVKAGQYVTFTCASGETAGSGIVTWYDKDGKVISTTQATASGATLTAGPAPKGAKSYEWTTIICIPPTPTTVEQTTTTAEVTTTTAEQTTTTAEQTTTTAEQTTTTTEQTTTTSSSTTTTLPATTTTLPDPNTYLTGTAVLYGINDSEGRYLAIIYGIPGLPLYPGSDPAFVQDCPAGTTVSFSQSTFTYPVGVTVTDFGGTFVAENTTDNTVTVTYKIACVPT
jgi:hypothetical protein